MTFLLTPLREGRHAGATSSAASSNFYSRPCGRGDGFPQFTKETSDKISTHAPAGGATADAGAKFTPVLTFLLTPLREGRRWLPGTCCAAVLFLLTPLREGRLRNADDLPRLFVISTHAPAGGATQADVRGPVS